MRFDDLDKRLRLSKRQICLRKNNFKGRLKHEYQP